MSVHRSPLLTCIQVVNSWLLPHVRSRPACNCRRHVAPTAASLLAQPLAQALQVRGQHFPLHIIQATGTRRQLSFNGPNALSSLLPAR